MISQQDTQVTRQTSNTDTADNFAAVQKVLPPSVTLIAVTKKQPIEKIETALAVGQRVFGENYVQEAYEHWHEKRHSIPELQLHLLGPLQTNKVKEAVALFDAIHTLDRLKIVEALAHEQQRQNKQLACFIQVNTGEELQKSGILPHELETFYTQCCDLKLNIVGLMCIPPIHEPAGLHFCLLRALGEKIGLTQFSMGMSDDWHEAVKAGATHIRLGTALFGARV